MIMISLYLVHFREESTADQLVAEVFPEFQLPDSSAKLLPAIHMIVRVRWLAVQSGAGGLRRHIHLTHPGDLSYNDIKNRRWALEMELFKCNDIMTWDELNEIDLLVLPI